jgi:uncharacterized membrane protein
MQTAYHSLPFGSLIAFFGIYLGIVNNKNISRFVRFNAMQVCCVCVYVCVRAFAHVWCPCQTSLVSVLKSRKDRI